MARNWTPADRMASLQRAVRRDEVSLRRRRWRTEIDRLIAERGGPPKRGDRDWRAERIQGLRAEMRGWRRAKPDAPVPLHYHGHGSG